jgi:hypothetical protein
MQEFTKSMLSFSWSMSLFGMQQLGNLLTRPDPNQPKSKAAEAFDNVTRTTEEHLGDVLKESFKAGDKFQRAMVDMIFQGWRSQGMGQGGIMQAATDAMRQATGCCGQDGDATGQDAAGWGPMPAADAPAGTPPYEGGSS